VLENGIRLEIKTHRKSGDQPAFPSETARKQFYTKSLTVLQLLFNLPRSIMFAADEASFGRLAARYYRDRINAAKEQNMSSFHP
jgi:hypothetical protein